MDGPGTLEEDQRDHDSDEHDQQDGQDRPDPGPPDRDGIRPHRLAALDVLPPGHHPGNRGGTGRSLVPDGESRYPA